jgi:hypothetical protein
MKSTLKVKHCARYTDDFVIVSEDIESLKNLLAPIQNFLNGTLQLSLHPKKVEIRKYSQGIDFLGYILLPHHIMMRKRTWKRILRKYGNKVAEYQRGDISTETLNQSLQSYLGNLSHADAYKKGELLKNQAWFN